MAKKQAYINALVPFSLFATACEFRAINDVRAYLTGVFITNNTIQATNGGFGFDSQYQKHPKTSESISKSFSFIVRPLNKLPRNKKIKMVLIEQTGMKSAMITYLDMDLNPLHSDPADVLEGDFPDLSKIITDALSLVKKEKEPTNQINVNPEYLAKTLNNFHQNLLMPGRSVRINLSNEASPLVITISHPQTECTGLIVSANAAIMPIRS